MMCFFFAGDGRKISVQIPPVNIIKVVGLVSTGPYVMNLNIAKRGLADCDPALQQKSHGDSSMVVQYEPGSFSPVS